MCVYPVDAGYHCKTCKCVMNNKGLQKPPIFKKNKKKLCSAKMLSCDVILHAVWKLIREY